MAATSRSIDVSEYQGAQDWAARVRGGLTLAFAKATEGERATDAHYRMHMSRLLPVVPLPGAYHFAWPNQDAATEAAHYIATVKSDATGRPFVHALDVEPNKEGTNYAGASTAQIRAYAEAWIDHVRAAFPGQRVLVYMGGADIAKGRMPRNADGLWYPAYPAGPLTYTQAGQRTRPAPSGIKPLLWQFASSPLDQSIAYMTPEQLLAWATPEEDMPSADEIATAVVTKFLATKKDNPATADNSQATWGGILWQTGANAAQANAAVRTLVAQVGAQSAALAALAKGGPLKVADIEAAAEAGARAALADSTVTVHVDVTQPDKPAAPAAG